MLPRKTGLISAISAYVLWGSFPVYFHAIASVSAPEILAHRIIWSVGFLGLVTFFMNGFKTFRKISRQELGYLLVGAFLISSNWLVFTYAIVSGQTLEASFGYFINPIFIVLLGVIVFHDKLNPGKWTALGLASAGVLYQFFSLGNLPWIALHLALTFGLYGILKKKMKIPAIQALLVETLLAAPIALGYLYFLSQTGKLQFLHGPLSVDLLLACAGFITSIPLVLFTMGASRLPYSTMGFLQFITPTLHFIIAIFVFREPISTSKLISFGWVWSGLAVMLLTSYLNRTTNPKGKSVR